ncbi:MAG: TetR/AcrR family transcriptional regulator [Aristaeellaceae bacterium]
MKQGKRCQRTEETRAQVLQEAIALFLAQGYQDTTIEQIAARTRRTKSAVLRAYPDKEAILYALVVHMFAVQFGCVRSLLGTDAEPLLVYGVETALQLHICEQSASLRDVYTSAYTLPSTTDFIYKSTARELQQIFGPYLPNAALGDFYELDLVSASVMRGLMAQPCDMYFTIDRKIALFLRCALKVFDVPEAKREEIVARVLAMDLAAVARSTVEKTIQQSRAGFDANILRASAADERELDTP